MVDEAMLPAERLSALLNPLTFKTRLIDGIYVWCLMTRASSVIRC